MEWWGWLASGLGAVILISNGVKALRDLFAPAIKVARKVEELEKLNKKYEKHFAENDTRWENQECTNQAILKALVALVNHEIDGNGIEGLKKVREELSNNIIERQ